MKKILKLNRKIYHTYDMYKKTIKELETELKDKIEFEFFIFHQTDGFVIADYDGHNALLGDCLATIKSKGVLSETDFIDDCI